MAELDEVSRYGLKLEPEESIRWAVFDLDPDLVFSRWQDTSWIGFPGDPERRGDTVSELISRSGTQQPWALFLEVEADLKRMTVARMLEYDGRLSRELRHGPHGRDIYPVAGCVIFLSGVRDDLVTSGELPGTNLGGVKRYRAWCLEAKDARETLARIERGELGRTILIWVVLMKGGDDPSLIPIWVKLLQMEPSSPRRAEIAGLALVFASWRGLQKIWGPTLEGFDVDQIPIVREWKDAARREGLDKGVQQAHRHDIRTVVQVRFEEDLPPDLDNALQQMEDAATLEQWFRLSLKTPTLADFRAAIVSSRTNGIANPKPPGNHSTP